MFSHQKKNPKKRKAKSSSRIPPLRLIVVSDEPPEKKQKTEAKEKKPSETVAQQAKILLEKFIPFIDWDIVNANELACVLSVGNRYGLFASTVDLMGAIKNIETLSGISMTESDDFEAKDLTYIGRGITIENSDAFFSDLLGRLKKECAEKLTQAEQEFSNAIEAEKVDAKAILEEAHTEFEAIEALAEKINSNASENDLFVPASP